MKLTVVEAALIAAIVLTFVLIGVGAWYGAGIEADTYNRLTGSNVTQWEALWIELRVDCNS